jgi:outer membrane protein OmpA-like peptidoglycan-associated protein
MSESLFASLLNTLDRRGISDIAGSLGESEQSISKGMESSIACALGGMAKNSEDPGTLRRLLDLVPASIGDLSWSNLASAFSNPNSPLMAAGRRMVSGLFGANDTTVAAAVGREAGLSSGTATGLLTMAAPMVMNFISKRVRDQGLNMASLGTLLQQETSNIRNALPAGLSDLFWPRAAATTAATTPIVAQSVRQEKSSLPGWGAALALGLLALGAIWLFNHGRRTVADIGTVPSGMASRVANEGLGNLVKRRLPDNVWVIVPENGIENRMLVFVENPNARVGKMSWFDFDRLTFDTGSATLRPDSKEQLDNIAEIMKAYPNVRTRLAGFTDSTGTPDQNLKLSRDRAEAVKSELVARGVAADRMTTEGFGEQNSAANNATEAGRAQNRRVTLMIIQK